jgi:AbrB family looped-hinge helix DNA binding protein
MTMKVGPKGQVVVPKTVRDELGIHPGDEVDVVAEGGEVRIRRAARFRDFLGCVPAPPGGMAAWDAETAAERAREDDDVRSDRRRGP